MIRQNLNVNSTLLTDLLLYVKNINVNNMGWKIMAIDTKNSSNVGLGTITQQHNIYKGMHSRGLNSVKHLKSIINKPSYDKKSKTFNLSEVSRLINVPRSTIKDKEQTGNLHYADGLTTKTEYNLDDIKIIREYFKKGFFNGSTTRPPDLKPLTIAMAMFKGGVGKTTHATHLAAHCAISGLRTKADA